MATYKGVSIVDYLKSVGKPSDITSRITLGKQYGIDYSKSTTDYATENTRLLGLLRGGTQPTTAPTLGIQPTPITTGGTTTSAIVPQPTIPQTQVTTQPPIITTSTAPKIGVSQIDAGKSAIKDLTAIGVNTDINTIRRNWSKFGLNTKLGNWIGSTTQWNAYAKYAKDELEGMKAGLKGIQTQITGAKEQVGGTTPTDVAGGVTTQLPETTTQPPGVAKTVVNTASLISDISTGVLKIPEMELAKEATDLAKTQEKARATQALETVQQDLATRGMAFSSIRSTAEARLQAQHLAQISGISMKLAGAIIDAARQESLRQEPKYYSVGNTLYEILPGQEPRKIIEGPPAAPEVIGSATGGYFQWNATTGAWESTKTPLTTEGAPETRVVNGILYQWDEPNRSWEIAPGIPSLVGGMMSDDEWKNAITMGIDKLSSIEDVNQKSRVLKLLSSRETLLEDDKDRFEYLITSGKITVVESETQVWQSFIDGDITVEEADTLINFIKNLEARMMKEKRRVKTTPGMYGEALKETVTGIPSGVEGWFGGQFKEIGEFGKGLLELGD